LIELPFAKYVGCGNDFIAIDNRHLMYNFQPKIIGKLCHRHKGIGADGVLFLELSEKADYRMRIFNADGKEASMCGNGLRCLIQWISTLENEKRDVYHIEVMHNILQACFVEDDISIDMGTPQDIQWNTLVEFESQKLLFHYLNTGVPHAVLFGECIDSIPLKQLGPYIRNHPLWGPQGCNVTLAERIGLQELKIRTYERGVEAETLACGTGATAAVLAAAHQYQVTSPVVVQTLSGEHLIIKFDKKKQEFFSVSMRGPARCTFKGTTILEFLN
jgi:diaminopimelate epimerase